FPSVAQVRQDGRRTSTHPSPAVDQDCSILTSFLNKGADLGYAVDESRVGIVQIQTEVGEIQRKQARQSPGTVENVSDAQVFQQLVILRVLDVSQVQAFHDSPHGLPRHAVGSLV